MSDMKVFQFLIEAAEKWPDKKAILDQEGELSFAELLFEVDKVKDILKNNGLKEGSGLGVMARNGRGFVIAVFAGLACGATVMPISHQFKKYELEQLLLKASLHAIVDDCSGAKPLESFQEITVGQESYRLSWYNKEQKEKFVPHVIGAAFVRFTSGTTAESKGVVMSHNSVDERTAAAQEALQLGDHDVVVWVLPMAYHFIVSIVMYVRFGITMAICKDLFAKTIIETINTYQGTFLYAAPMHYQMLAKDSTGEMLPSLKRAISTSSGVGAETAAIFKQRFDLSLSQAYGIIEIGLPVLDLTMADPASIGQAAPGFEVGILGNDFKKLGIDAIGQLAIRGPGMFEAYMSPAKALDEVLVNGWFLTGDLASQNKEGLIYVQGREKSMINVAGNKAFPEEVEEVIGHFPGVKNSRVFGKPHTLMGEVVMAEVVMSQGSGDAKSIRNHCRKHLSVYKVPQEIVFVDEIEMTDSGKIVRHS